MRSSTISSSPRRRKRAADTHGVPPPYVVFSTPRTLHAHAAKEVPGYFEKIVALNAADGSPRWTYELPVFTTVSPAGDEANIVGKLLEGQGDSSCMADAFNQGVINGFGSVFIGHSNGRLYAIRDSNSDGRIDADTEVSYYAFGEAFQAEVGLAPGLAAVVPCSGGLYVWKS